MINNTTMNRPVIWTDADLDGAGSYTILKWITGKEYDIHITTAKKFADDFKRWCALNENNSKLEIYILDIDTSPAIDLIDLPNITVFDHHPQHVENKSKYKNAVAYVEPCSSCTRLIYKHYSNEVKSFTKEQIALIAYVDDYDCYLLKYPQSYILNVVYWNLSGNKIIEFYNQFHEGFKGFTSQHDAMYKIHKKKLEVIKQSLQLFQKNITIQNVPCNIIGTFTDYALNDVATYLIDEKNADIAIIVNLKSKTVSFRKKDDISVDLGKMANVLCDGGGHEYASGGKITEKFMLFCKQLIPI
jgi:oligoribonuclease NrnB/cAMP/cGMP phosphodiesterase (DHH superfamily)